MRNEAIRILRTVQQSIGILIGCCSILIVMLTSCNGELTVQRDGQPATEKILPSKYSIIFVIHGDGDYLVHDTNGYDYKADETILAEAKIVAQLNPEGDVFIFHQKPKAHFLFLFPIHDGEFYYYNNGKLTANELYWRDRTPSQYDAEVELYRQYHREFQSEMMSMFFYFGHEVPEIDGKGYDASYPQRSFTVNVLAEALKDFTRNSAKFNLLTLATCYGGTPYTISTLGPYAQYIIASPENLHLSYFDLHSMARLDTGLHVRDMSSFARSFSQQAFDQLTKTVQTTVSITVYDVNRVQEYLHRTYPLYDQTLNSLKGEKRSDIEHCDCAVLPQYILPTMKNGVEVLYRPARFGRGKQETTHSGWECLRKRENAIESASSLKK